MTTQLIITRRDVMRPILSAVTLTVLGELIIFVLWGTLLFPSGNLLHKLGWTLTCGIAMGATIGAFVNVVVTGRLQALIAALSAGGIYFAVLGVCVFLCYYIDQSTGYFGASEAPQLFILGGLIPAALTSIIYGWFLHLRPRARES